VASSPHGNYVLQKYVEVMPVSELEVVIEGFRGHAFQAAQHQLQSRVLERLFRHGSVDQTNVLAAELIPRAAKLSKHPFGNFVVQRMLGHLIGSQLNDLLMVLAGSACRLAMDKLASNVVRTALSMGRLSDRAIIAEALGANPSELSKLSRHKRGSWVIKELKRYWREVEGGKDESSSALDTATATGTAECSGSDETAEDDQEAHGSDDCSEDSAGEGEGEAAGGGAAASAAATASGPSASQGHNRSSSNSGRQNGVASSARSLSEQPAPGMPERRSPRRGSNSRNVGTAAPSATNYSLQPYLPFPTVAQSPGSGAEDADARVARIFAAGHLPANVHELEDLLKAALPESYED